MKGSLFAAIIPNIPFYFCAWRSWSHWKGEEPNIHSMTSPDIHLPAWRSSTYLNQLFTQQYFEPTTDGTLDKIYDSSSVITEGGSIPIVTPSKLSITDSTQDTPEKKEEDTPSIESDPAVESQMLLRPADIPALTSEFNLPPAVGAEILRALDQSRMRLKKELKEEKKSV